MKGHEAGNQGLETPTRKDSSVVSFHETGGETTQYTALLEEAYAQGTLPSLPELEVFGVGSVDTEAILDFTQALIDVIRTHEETDSRETQVQLHHFCQKVHSELFSASPNLVNYIPLSERLSLMAKATRSDVIQKTFGSVLVGETVYDISFMGNRLDTIMLQVMEELSVPEQLDLLHQLRAVGAQAIANGEWSRPAYNQVRHTYETLVSLEDSTVFVQLAAKAGLETLDAEYENPQLGFVRFEGQTNDSRLHTRSSEEDIELYTDKFFSSYALDGVAPSSTKILPAAYDALVCSDRSGLASGIVKINTEQFLSSPAGELNFDVNQYRLYKQDLDTAERFPDQKRYETVVKIYRSIYGEYAGALVASGDVEHAAKIFTEILPILNTEEWQAYFVGEMKRQEYPSESELYKKAGDENGRVSHEFVTGLFKYRDQLGAPYAEDYLELEAALQHDDAEHSFEIASCITLKCQHEKQPTAAHREVSTLQDTVREAHIANFKIARQQYEVAMTELSETKEIQARAEVVRKIEDHLDELGDNLQAFIEGKLATAEDLPRLQIVTLKELMAEVRGVSDHTKITEEDILLFQHVHSSELAHKIEHEFGFHLADLTVKEQFHFLGYLKQVTSASADAMKQFVQTYGINGLRTFLSLENEGHQFGDALVSFGARTESAQDIFAQYGALVLSARDTGALIEGHVTDGISVDSQTEEVIRHTIMTRAHDLLKSAVLSDQPEALGQKLQQVSTEGIIFASIFRSLFAEGNFSLEQMKETTFGVESGAELTPEDIAEMERLYRQSYAQAEFRGPFVDGLVARMHETIRDASARWSILRHKGTPIGFCRFMDQKEAGAVTQKHFGAFNVNPAYGNGKLGEAMFLSVLASEGNDSVPIIAECLPHAPISAKYIESGFDAIGTDTYEGHTVLKIERTTASSGDPRKQLPSADILAGNIPPGATLRRIADTDTFPELQNAQKMIRLIPSAAGLYALFVPKG